jgi:tight adherence protein B
MDQTTLLAMILVASSVALGSWGAILFFGEALGGGKRKLHERLSSDTQRLQLDPAFTKKIRRKVELAGFSGKLVGLPGMAAVHHSLEQTWPDLPLAKFIGFSAGAAAGAFIVALGILESIALAAVVAGAAGAFPFMILSMRRGHRQQMLNEQLPEALDFLGRILRAGQGLSTGLQMISEELPDPLASEFRRAYDAHSLGQNLDEALKDTAARIDSADFGFFVTAVLIQRQTGGDLAEVLDNISNMIRGRIRLQQQVKAKTAEGRFTGYILTAFPVVMFFLSYALNPTYASVLLHGTGLYLLCTAGGLCLTGLFFIRKITKVRV